MPNKPSWRRPFTVVGALMAIAITGWIVRDFSPSSETAQRAELELHDGVLTRRGATQPFSGLLISDWRARQRRTEVSIRDGRAHGRSRGWYENGQLEVEETFVRGVSHGTRTRWFADGAKKSQVTIRDGRLAGVFREWHPNGKLARETPLVDGVPHGEVRDWNAQGQLVATARVERGQRVAGK